MSKGKSKPGIAAFTLNELMITIFVCAVLAFVLLPAFAPRRSRRPYTRINCASNLKQVALAFKLWSGDQSDNYPQEYVGTTNAPLINNPNPILAGSVGVPWTAPDTSCPNMFTIFLTMSNELSNPKILVCPGDTERIAPTNFYNDLLVNKNSKVSYFVGKDAEAPFPQMMLAGDRNISADTTVKSAPFGYSPKTNGISPGYIKALGTNAAQAPLNGPNFGWTEKIHKFSGNVALADGSVQQYTQSGLKQALQHSGDTNAIQNVLLFP
jgi:prepilin-type processing-associated H-X9-DG protein